MTLPKSSSINNYGSGVLKDAVPLVDPTSELGAAALNPLRNDVSAMTNVSPRLLFQFVGNATAPIVSSSATWTSGNDSVWGNASGVTPVLLRNSTGNILVTLPASVQDQIGNTNLVNIRNAEVSIGGGTVGKGQVSINSASTFTIYLFNSSSSTSDLVSSLIFVKVY